MELETPIQPPTQPAARQGAAPAVDPVPPVADPVGVDAASWARGAGGAAALASAFIAACGGGGGGGDGALTTASGERFEFKAAAYDPRLLERAQPQAASAAVPWRLPSDAEFYAWAEANFAIYFPGPQSTASATGFTFRFYPATQTYLAIQDGKVYALGPATANALTQLGSLGDFATSVFPWQLAATDAQAARFLLQAQFSASTGDIAAVRDQGYPTWLDAQLNTPLGPTGWDWLMSQGYNVEDFANNPIPSDYMMWNQLITSSDTVRKRAALALSEFFVIGSSGINIVSRAFAVAEWWDLLVRHAFGNFRTLLEAVTLNPAMGVYLNTRGNQKEDTRTGRLPDENYAREVMQLFTIGLVELNPDGTPKAGPTDGPIETYDQNAITNLARVFTGWNFDSTGATAVTNPLQVRNPMKLTAALHSTLAASFLGTTIPANTSGTEALRIALDTLFAHPNVGPFLARQMIQRLVTSNPTPAYVGRVAAVFNNNGSGVRGDLKAMFRAIWLDDEARDPARMADPNFGKLREPMLRLVQWARTFGATSAAGTWKIGDMSSESNRLGQSPMRSPSVFNYFRPGYVPPNTAFATSGLVAPELQITNESSVAGYLNFLVNTAKNGVSDVSTAYPNEIALAGDPSALVARLNLLLCADQLSATQQQTIRDAIGTISLTSTNGPLNRVASAIVLVMGSAAYLAQR